MAIKVQLVIQGGGAKIFALMAFLDALQNFKPAGQDQKIEVVSIIGSSAGAIAGTLFAAGADIGALRATFKERGAGRYLVEQFAKPRWKLWKALRILRLLVFRTPIWSQSEIENFLQNHLPRDIVKFSDIKTKTNIDVFVLATDLSHLRPAIFTGEQAIVEALLHSAAIPFFFRCWHSPVDKKSTLYVDGGIAENFPANALALPPGVHRVGLTFNESGTGTPTSALEFSVSLLNAALSVATQYSVRDMNPENVHTLQTKVSTFDFGRLIGELGAFENDYDFLKHKATEWLNSFTKTKLNSLSTWDKNPWAEENETAVNLMRRLYFHYIAHEASIKFKYHSVVYQVCVNSLLDAAQGDDEFRCEMKFSALHDPVRILLIQFMDSLTWGMTKRDSAIEVLNSDQDRLEIEVFPVIDEVGTRNRILLVFLKKPIVETDGICTLRYQDKARTFFPGLVDRLAVRQQGRDDMVLNPSRSATTIDDVRFYWEIPEIFVHRTTLSSQPDNCLTGQRMTTQQCNALGHIKAGFSRIGWMGRGVSKRWGVDVTID